MGNPNTRRKKRVKCRYRYPKVKQLKRNLKRKSKHGFGANLPTNVVKENWNFGKTAKTNFQAMGLVYNPNTDVNQLNKNITTEMVKLANPDYIEPTDSTHQPENLLDKKCVIQEIEHEANIPRVRQFKIPGGRVKFLSYLLDRYNHDYKKMSHDPKNIWQQTPSQLRKEIRTFKTTNQYKQFLSDRNLTEDDMKDVNSQINKLLF